MNASVVAPKLSDQLKAAYALIGAGKDESKWTRNAFARDKTSAPVSSKSSEAVCWCSVGAIVKAAGRSGFDWAHASFLLAQSMGTTTIDTFNDSHTYAEVCAAWERAIAKAEASEAGA